MEEFKIGHNVDIFTPDDITVDWLREYYMSVVAIHIKDPAVAFAITPIIDIEEQNKLSTVVEENYKFVGDVEFEEI